MMEKYSYQYILSRLDFLELRVEELSNAFSLDTYFTIQEVADSLKITPITIQRKISAGDIEAIKIGKEYRISKKAIESFLINLSTKK